MEARMATDRIDLCGLPDSFQRAALDALRRDGVDHPCTECGKVFRMREGANRCPHCGKTVDVRLDIDYR